MIDEKLRLVDCSQKQERIATFRSIKENRITLIVSKILHAKLYNLSYLDQFKFCEDCISNTQLRRTTVVHNVQFIGTRWSSGTIVIRATLCVCARIIYFGRITKHPDFRIGDPENVSCLSISIINTPSLFVGCLLNKHESLHGRACNVVITCRHALNHVLGLDNGIELQLYDTEDVISMKYLMRAAKAGRAICC